MKNIFAKASKMFTYNSVWILASVFIGACAGIIGSFFHIVLEAVTEIRHLMPYLVFFLPIAGVAIAVFYLVVNQGNNKGTDEIMEAVKDGNQVTWLFIPLIFVSTALTHLFGGSAGREGAALQIGGSLGSCIGKAAKLKNEHMRLAILCGMSSTFTALFGTPIAATVFTIEFISVGIIHYSALFPCLIGSLTAMGVASLFGIEPTSFTLTAIPELNFKNIILCIVLSIFCALVSIIFCHVMHETSRLAKKIKSPILRAFTGGIFIIILTYAVGNYNYNGAGMEVIERAIAGQAVPWAFILKIIFTAITIGFGFKGGEIVPSFFIGATFGCVVGGLIGIPPSFGAALGLIGVFCGVTNAPIASIFMAVEIFGNEGFVFFAITCFLSFVLSGNIGLYESQRHLFSKDGTHSELKPSSGKEFYIK